MRQPVAQKRESEGGSSLKLLLSADGELVRDILLDEVAKVGRANNRCRQVDPHGIPPLKNYPST